MGIGGIAAVVLGAVADAVDLKTALTISAVAPALGVFVCLRLPRPACAAPPCRRADRGGLTSCSSGSAISISSAATSTRRSRSTPRCSARSASSRRSSFRASAASRSTTSASRRPGSGSLGLRQALVEQEFDLYAPGLHHFAFAVETRDEVDGVHARAAAGRRDPARADGSGRSTTRSTTRRSSSIRTASGSRWRRVATRGSSRGRARRSRARRSA